MLIGHRPKQFLRRLHTPVPQAQQNRFPTLLRFPEPRLHGQEVLAATRVTPHHPQKTAPLPAAHVHVDAVHPLIYELLAMPVPLAPLSRLALPAALEPRNRRRRQSLHRFAEQRRECLTEVVRRYPLQVTATELPPPPASPSSNTAAAVPRGNIGPPWTCPASAEHEPAPARFPLKSPKTTNSRCEQLRNAPKRHARPNAPPERPSTPLPRPGG